MQESKLYVGNLNYSTTESQLGEFFAQYGEVKSVNIIEGRGFGFVEMSTQEEAEKAKEELDGKELAGRVLKIDKARPKKERRNDNRYYNR